MTGTVSDQVLFRNCSMLKKMDLSYSGLNIHIDSAPWIPPFQLWTLNFRGCKIGGPIPSWISTQFELEDVDLSDANLVDDIPSWLWEFSSALKSLNLLNNHLEGPVPVSSIPLTLRVLDLSVNELNGPLLLDIQHDVFVEVLLLADNKIQGPIPVSLGIMTDVVLLDLSKNQLRGNIPVTLGDLQSLEVLHLENNQLTGEIPASLTNLGRLVVLNLGSNELEGEIPKELGKLAGLTSVHLEKNNLQGLLPLSLAQLSHLQVLDVGGNNLTGNVPAWIANCSRLQVLMMRSNNFKGKLPPQIGKMPRLRLLDLSSNLLFGEIPDTYFSFSAMAYGVDNISVLGEDRRDRYFISDALVWLTTVFGENRGGKYYIEGLDLIIKGSEWHYGRVLSGMTCIDLSNNRLWGHLSAEIGNLKGLMFLNLSRNSFNGDIPGSMGNLRVIPQQGRHMITFDKSVYLGNTNLRGCPVECWKCCPIHSSLSPPIIDVHEETKQGFSWYDVSIGWSIAAGFSAVLLVLTFKVNWRKKSFDHMDRVITFLLGVKYISFYLRLKGRQEEPLMMYLDFIEEKMKLVLNESHIPYQAEALNPSVQSQGDWKETKSFYIGPKFSKTSGDQKNRFYEPMALKRFIQFTLTRLAPTNSFTLGVADKIGSAVVKEIERSSD
ncbi:LRR receptor-like serine/threonine-protein kinase SIK1 [Cryptomeria japonica]|uniref:LRR receptor-like serine/threonine-protein kinase SIK1 n=1 Tax=Cryptomeria japonica TaxID=3369 RepID=UPI0027DA2B63|nr:LRR receptor-like serine/threonine-protein kinase SIK1 [Cryptomeria japonica]